MSPNPPSHEQTNAEGGDTPTDEHQGDGPIADSIQAFRKDYAASEQQNNARHKEIVTWQRRTAYGLAAYTLLTFALVILGKCSLDSNNEGNAAITRAWVHPQSVGQAGSTNGTIFNVFYTNDGREPAFGLVTQGKIDVIPAPSGVVNDWMALPVWNEVTEIKQANICEGIDAKTGREVLFPNGSNSFQTERNPAVPADWMTQGNRVGILIIYGCMAYRSPVMQGDRHTSFCFYIAPATNLPTPPYCPVGNYAE